jgi:hypothetical protein
MRFMRDDIDLRVLGGSLQHAPQNLVRKDHYPARPIRISLGRRSRQTGSGRPGAMVGEAINPDIIKKRMWLDYHRACSDPVCERQECVHELLSKLMDPSIDLHKFLQEAVDILHTKLYLSEVTIGLRHSDASYKYEVMAGLQESEWKAHQRLSYVHDQFVSKEVYKYEEVSALTRLFLVEDNPYAIGEDETYQKDLTLLSKRKSLEDFIEGDYIDTLIIGAEGELWGWIEYSGMDNGKFPDGQTIKSIELLASVIAVAIRLLGTSEAAAG